MRGTIANAAPLCLCPDRIALPTVAPDITVHSTTIRHQRGAARGMAQIRVGELSLEYERFGPTNRETVLLIMGLGAQMTRWPVALCEALVDRGLHVIRFDNRDIGLSTKLDALGLPDIGAIFAARS